MNENAMSKAKAHKTKEDIVRHVTTLPDGTHIIEHVDDGRLERKKSQTDWTRLGTVTDAEIEASIVNDPEWAEFKDIDWSDTVVVLSTRKKAISIRIDEDVLDFFKKDGEGYQRRMNAVLRSYMQQKSNKTA